MKKIIKIVVITNLVVFLLPIFFGAAIMISTEADEYDNTDNTEGNEESNTNPDSNTDFAKLVPNEGLYYPLEYFVRTAGYPNYDDGAYHGAIDLVAIGNNKNVYPVAEGKVYAVGSFDYWKGNYVYIAYNIDGKTISTAYFHMESPTALQVGDEVTPNTIVGIMGTTGNSTGPHLHFEVAIISNITIQDHNINRIDPTVYFPIPIQRGVVTESREF